MSQLLQGHQIDLFGVAEVKAYRERFPEIKWVLPSDLPRAVVLTYPLFHGVMETIDGSPNHLYFHHYRQLNYQLDRAALAVGRLLESWGFKCLPIAASQTLDAQDLSAHLSHRHMAFMAGLGIRGKNNLLVSRKYGSGLRLVSVLTDAPLATATALEEDLCGNCHLCRDACPSGAIGDRREDFELGKCFEMVSEFRKMPRIGQRICGVCQNACIRQVPKLK